MSLNHPLIQLLICHIKAYLREPEVIFWTYGFPILMVLGLGLAFRSPPAPVYQFGLLDSPAARELAQGLGETAGLSYRLVSREEGFSLLRRNQINLLVELTLESGVIYHYDDTNPENRVTRLAVDRRLQSHWGRSDVLPSRDQMVRAPGSRYVDFLVPGLIGMNLMGGGIWGVGFILVDMRVKKLLKRLLGTPLPPYQLLLSLVASRMVFFLPEGLFLLIAAGLMFAVPIQGSWLALIVTMLAGALCFTGLGLLVASRARRIEVVSGLMNVVMLPMWLCSGIFFSSERFPDWMQPFVQALPLTQLINALRGIMLEGATFLQEGQALLIMAAWTLGSFLVAFRLFRWED